MTYDYYGLDEIIDYYATHPDTDRNKMVVVLTDGQSSNVTELQKRIATLRNVPKLGLHAIGIQDTHAETNYAPNGTTVKRVEELPATLANMVTRMFT